MADPIDQAEELIEFAILIAMIGVLVFAAVKLAPLIKSLLKTDAPKKTAVEKAYEKAAAGQYTTAEPPVPQSVPDPNAPINGEDDVTAESGNVPMAKEGNTELAAISAAASAYPTQFNPVGDGAPDTVGNFLSDFFDGTFFKQVLNLPWGSEGA